MPPLLTAQSLSKSFTPETSAVDGVSFNVRAGEIICLLGPSGCGKTTLLRMIAGLAEPDAGEVLFAGQSIRRTPPHRRDFGMMFQDFALFPHLTVFENVAFGLRMRKDDESAIRKRVAEMLDLVDLAGFDERDVGQLSGGEQQRVALARSLAPGPRLLMLDEPLGALDRALRERLMLDLRAILKQVGVTAIYVTHDQTEAFAIADRVAVMNAGRIEQLDRPQVVFERPATPFVARFLGFVNLLSGAVTQGGAVCTPLGLFPMAADGPADRPVTLLLRPEAAYHLAAGEPRQAAAGITFEATIKAISFRGRYHQVWFSGPENTSLMFEFKEVADWQVGDQVELGVDTAACLLLGL